jgi:hypothetical protein
MATDTRKHAEVSGGVRWLSPLEVSMRLGVSRSQVSRLAVKHSWKKLDVSTSPQAKNAGVRYLLSSIEQYERDFSY